MSDLGDVEAALGVLGAGAMTQCRYPIQTPFVLPTNRWRDR